MLLRCIVFIVVILISICALMWMRKIAPWNFGPYLIWVIFCNLVSLMLFRPWMIFC